MAARRVVRENSWVGEDAASMIGRQDELGEALGIGMTRAAVLRPVPLQETGD